MILPRMKSTSMRGRAQGSHHLTESVCDVGYVVQGAGEMHTVPKFAA